MLRIKIQYSTSLPILHPHLRYDRISMIYINRRILFSHLFYLLAKRIVQNTRQTIIKIKRQKQTCFILTHLVNIIEHVHGTSRDHLHTYGGHSARNHTQPNGILLVKEFLSQRKLLNGFKSHGGQLWDPPPNPIPLYRQGTSCISNQSSWPTLGSPTNHNPFLQDKIYCGLSQLRVTNTIINDREWLALSL